MPSGGFWKRPATRMYSYNLDLGEHYYSPMTSYLDTERATRGETPGALTFSERLARKWVNGRRYEASELRDRYARSSSLAREATTASSSSAAERIWRPEAARAARAVSEMPSGQGQATSAWLNRRAMQEQASASSASAQSSQMAAKSTSVQQSSSQQQSSSTTVKSTKQESTCCEEVVQSESTKKMALLAKQKLESERKAFLSGYSASSQQKKAVSAREEEFKIKVSEKQSDDVCKKVADIHMQPWANRSDMQDAEEASARARARIAELERELEEITKKALMSSSKCLKTAKQMAYQASMEAEEEAKAMSSKKSKKVMIQSSTSIRG
jgi:hypothetical protein